MQIIPKRFYFCQNKKTIAKGIILDPIFKKDAFGIEEDGNNSQKLVIDKLSGILQNDQYFNDSNDTHS